MKKVKTTLTNLIGTNYQAGEKIGQWVLSRPDLLQKAILPPHSYPSDQLAKAEALLDRYCAGVNEEIRGFSDTVNITKEQAIFYASTYLERGCSLMAALPSKTQNGHTLMARNYDFNDDMEEMCFAYTAIEGKYRYIGSTVNLFGRSDGMNEHGLAACNASNGMPVGNFEGGLRPAINGFSFWVVMRSILEQCRTTEEAVAWAMDAPIAFNLNLMLADGQNKIALLQCMDGHKAVRLLDEGAAPGYLAVTNHVILPELKKYEKMLLDNSVVRCNLIEKMFAGHEKISVENMKELLAAPYPEGLCCHYYPEFFGTLRSMVFDTDRREIEMTFGSARANDWRQFNVQPFQEQEIVTNLPCEKMKEEFYKVL